MARRRASGREEVHEEASDNEEPPTQRRRLSDDADEPYGDGEDEGTQGDNSNHDQMVKNLVRLALSCEYTRTPIRRAEINTRVMGAHTRQFRKVFASAQQQLRDVFGMEMMELPAKEKITLQQKRAAAKSQYQKEAAKSQTQRANGKSQSQVPQPATNSWILTTILPQRLRIPETIPPPGAPTPTAESQYTALATFIVSIIMLNGGSVAETKLERFLNRANIDDVTPFSNSLATSTLDKKEKLLKKIERDGFIVKVRDNSSGEEVVEYVLGGRGKVEVGRSGVEGMVRTVYGETADQAELEMRLKRTLGRAQLATHEEVAMAS